MKIYVNFQGKQIEVNKNTLLLGSPLVPANDNMPDFDPYSIEYIPYAQNVMNNNLFLKFINDDKEYLVPITSVYFEF